MYLQKTNKQTKTSSSNTKLFFWTPGECRCKVHTHFRPGRSLSSLTPDKNLFFNFFIFFHLCHSISIEWVYLSFFVAFCWTQTVTFLVVWQKQMLKCSTELNANVKADASAKTDGWTTASNRFNIRHTH